MIILLALASLLASCLDAKIYGMDPADLLEKLEQGEDLSFFRHGFFNFQELTKLGPGSLLYLAMHAEQRNDIEAQERLLSAALKYEAGLYRKRAAQLLEALYTSREDHVELVRLYRGNAMELEATEQQLRLAESLQAAGHSAQALNIWRSLQADLAGQAETPALTRNRVSRGLIQSLLAEQDKLSENDLRLLRQAALGLLQLRGDEQLTQSFSSLVALGQKIFSADELALFEMRATTGGRDYGPALRSFLRYVAIRNHATVVETGQNLPDGDSGEKTAISGAPAESLIQDGPVAAGRQEPDETMLGRYIDELPFYTASDLARSWLFADPARGASLFRSLAAETSGPDSRRYLYNYYAGRFERSLQRGAQANSYFRTAAALATNSTDRDAAWWYLADGLALQNPAAAIAVLAEALPASDNPAWYSDVIEVLHRNALVQRNGRLLASLDAALDQKAEAGLQALVNYSLARAADIRIIGLADINAAHAGQPFADTAEYSQSRYRLAQNQRASTYYRFLAAYRLGETILEAVPDEDSPPVDQSNANSAQRSPEWQYLNGLSLWKLDGRLYREAVPLYQGMDAETFRLVATRLAELEDHANSVRVISRLLARTGHSATRADRELNWPKPFEAAMESALAATGIDRSLMYGLVRSESLFMPAVVSRAGAVGLAQLMPATAEEMAGRLRMREWDSTKPADNLLLGAAYLKRLLDANAGGVMAALFSYNAGPGRFRTWRQAAGNLPADLLLETLTFAETRQYGRNVALAALNYAVLYEKKEAAAYLRYLLNEE